MNARTLTFLILLFASSCFGQDNCDWKRIRGLGVIFQDTVGITRINEDLKIDTARSAAAQSIAFDYFDSCLKGKKIRYFRKLLGKGDLRIGDKASCGNCGSELQYSLAEYDENGVCNDPFPAVLRISFDEKKRAYSMGIMSF